MAVVDYELAWLDFKAYVASKRSHGSRDLLTAMAEIEVNRRVPEDQIGFDPGPMYRKPATEQPLELAAVRHG